MKTSEIEPPTPWEALQTYKKTNNEQTLRLKAIWLQECMCP